MKTTLGLEIEIELNGQRYMHMHRIDEAQGNISVSTQFLSLTLYFWRPLLLAQNTKSSYNFYQFIPMTTYWFWTLLGFGVHDVDFGSNSPTQLLQINYTEIINGLFHQSKQFRINLIDDWNIFKPSKYSNDCNLVYPSVEKGTSCFWAGLLLTERF